MASALAPTSGSPTSAKLRLAVALTSILVGLGVLAIGGAGIVGGESIRTGTVVGGLVALVGLLVVGARIPMGARHRAVTFVGMSLGLASLLLFWALVPPDAGPVSGLSGFAAVLGYATGMVVVLAGVLAAATEPEQAADRAEPAPEVNWVRQTNDARDGELAADGGPEEDDLSYPRGDDER